MWPIVTRRHATNWTRKTRSESSSPSSMCNFSDNAWNNFTTKLIFNIRRNSSGKVAGFSSHSGTIVRNSVTSWEKSIRLIESLSQFSRDLISISQIRFHPVVSRWTFLPRCTLPDTLGKCLDYGATQFFVNPFTVIKLFPVACRRERERGREFFSERDMEMTFKAYSRSKGYHGQRIVEWPWTMPARWRNQRRFESGYKLEILAGTENDTPRF